MISRGAKTVAEVVVVTLEVGGVAGRGEAVPYGRYGETPESVLAQIDDLADAIRSGADRATLQRLAPPGAARNALDCALWDLDAKRARVRAWTLAGVAPLEPVTTGFTLSLGSPDEMAEAAAAHAHRPFLKLKIGGVDDFDRVAAVRRAAPGSSLIVDANEAFGFDDLTRLAPEFARLGVRLIEQPLAADEDEQLEGYDSPVPLCADESLHSRVELDVCARRYSCVNIKLDKAGGLTEALALNAAARARGLAVMVGSMVGTSLGVAPAMILAQDADYVDLDGPLLLARDRDDSLKGTGSLLMPPSPELWG